MKPSLKDALKGLSTRTRMVRSVVGSAGVQAVSRALALVMGVILARTLGAEGYGVYAYAFAIMSLLMVLSEAGVPTLLMREVAAAEGRGSWGLLRGALLRGIQLVALVSVTIAAFGLVVLWLMNEKIPTVSLYTLAMMLLILPVAALSKTLAHGLRGLNKVVISQALELILRPALAIFVVGIFFSLDSDFRTPWIAMAGHCFALLVVVAFSAFLLKRYIPVEARAVPSEFQSRQWLKSAMPFTLISGALVINSQTDIIMLGWFMKDSDVGGYRVAVQVSMLIFFPLQVFQVVLASRFAGLYAAYDWEALRLIDRRSRYFVILLTAPILMTILLFSEQIVISVFGDSFRNALIPIAVLSVGFFANVTCGAAGTLLQMTRSEGAVLRVLVFTSALNIAGNFFLIPIIGVTGAAISTALTTFAYQFVLRYFANRMTGK